jgi:oligopeptide/dipeptide ABC transporter ATP-binding protein
MMLITHDLGIVAGIADRVAVMYGGQLVEVAPTRSLFREPVHPYTEALLKAVPRLDGPTQRLAVIPGSVPAATAWPAGCRFHPRCAHAWDRCGDEHPSLLSISDRHARCWLVEQPERRKP